MNAEQAIMARLSNIELGPVDSIGLHLAVVQLTGVAPGKESSAWAVTHEAIHRLEASGKIVRHVSGAYLLPTSARPEMQHQHLTRTTY